MGEVSPDAPLCSPFDQVSLLLNTLLLTNVAFLPFSTALLAEFIKGTASERRNAAIVYGGALLACAPIFNLVG